MTAVPHKDARGLSAHVAQWILQDPDPDDRAELTQLVRSGDLSELRDRFSGPLEFGTAGLRGRLGAGPNRMNRAVVIRTAAALTAYLHARLAELGWPNATPKLVIGFDARHRSRQFALDTAAVVTAAGAQATIFDAPGPTPLLAFAVRHQAADAGVMVTASHNPASDNGYKIYLGGRVSPGPGNGVQIIPPADTHIAARIANAPGATQIPRATEGWATFTPALREAYLAAALKDLVGRESEGDDGDADASASAPESPRGAGSKVRHPTPGAALVHAGTSSTPRERGALRIVNTSMHGVGGDLALEAFARAGFTDVIPVASQRDPDPGFPTAPFPNPEEPGALDQAIDLARDTAAHLVIAHDPDADRCAVAVDDPRAGGYRMLTGDEVGAVLGARAAIVGVASRGLRRPGEVGEAPTLASSLVSSRLLARIAAAAGLRHATTLTGFKWIARAPGLVFGYEEAIGYCVRPDMVRDKDGITAALAVADLAAALRGRGLTLLDLLDDLARCHGLHLTGQIATRFDTPEEASTIVARLAVQPPATVGGTAVVDAIDLRGGAFGLASTPGVSWTLADASRVIVRPSGTEPKLKCYLEVVRPVDPRAPYGDLTAARRAGATALADLAGAVRATLGV